MNKEKDTHSLMQYSEEVQEFMGQKPRALVWWGNIWLVFLLTAFFMINFWVTFTETHSYPITLLNSEMAFTSVSAKDVVQLKSGQYLWVSMEIYPQVVYGRFKACVSEIDLVPGEHGYGVTLNVCGVTDMNKSPKLVPGMKGTASFEISRRGFLRSLLLN